MIISIIKFFHIICGTAFFGIIIASFYYISKAIHKQDRSLIDYSLRASYFGDAVSLLCILILFASSIPLVFAGHFTLAVPWIFIAYHAFGFLSQLWLITLCSKRFYLSKNIISAASINIFYFLNIAMILIFIIIIHDAVTQSTALEFLFRK